jgi:hypothetical protein
MVRVWIGIWLAVAAAEAVAAAAAAAMAACLMVDRLPLLLARGAVVALDEPRLRRGRTDKPGGIADLGGAAGGAGSRDRALWAGVPVWASRATAAIHSATGAELLSVIWRLTAAALWHEPLLRWEARGDGAVAECTNDMILLQPGHAARPWSCAWHGWWKETTALSVLWRKLWSIRVLSVCWGWLWMSSDWSTWRARVAKAAALTVVEAEVSLEDGGRR